MTDARPVVLVIDDHADYLDILDFELRSQYAVVVAQNGFDGYALASQKRPDVIVIDLMMPVVDGWTVLRKLRLNPELTNTPVIVITAVDKNTVKRIAAHFQVVAVLQKPCPPAEVSAAVKAALTPAPDPH